jgi:hypothetical protein
MRKGVFAVVPCNPGLEIFGVFHRYRDEFLLALGSVGVHTDLSFSLES